jgi:hypothetical protein
MEHSDEAMRRTGEEDYPPYNIERTGEDHYQIPEVMKSRRIAINAGTDNQMLTSEGGLT